MVVVMRDQAAKRAIDATVAFLLVAWSWPLWAAIALAVRLTSAGPALYRSARVGRNGRPFLMLKFRTMYLGAERQGPGITARDDPRITPLGRLLRRTKLDELPQLINVLRGDMSLVGPRPEDPRYVRLDDPVQREVLSVRPGVTGPTQLQYRHEEAMLGVDSADAEYRTVLLPRKLAIDVAYVRGRSLGGDVRLLAQTAWALAPGRRGGQP